MWYDLHLPCKPNSRQNQGCWSPCPDDWQVWMVSTSFPEEKNTQKKHNHTQSGWDRRLISMTWKLLWQQWGMLSMDSTLRTICLQRHHLSAPFQSRSTSKPSLYGPSHTGGDSRYSGKCQRQVSVQAERQIHATHTYNDTLATHKEQFSVHCSILSKVLRCESKSSKLLHPVSLLMKVIIWCCFADGAGVAMLKSEEKASKRFTFWTWTSFKIPLLLRSAISDVSIWGQSK